MGNEVVYCSILLLLFVKLAPGLSSDPMSLKANVFGVIADTTVGNIRPFYFSRTEDPTPFEFFPDDQIRDIPFLSEALPQLLNFFSLSAGSPQALAMKQTLDHCEAEPPKVELSHCATSFESLLGFARHVFGHDRVTILRSPPVSGSTPPVQNYTVVGSEEVSAGKMIPCHYQAYPYAVYHCHYELASRNKLFVISLRGDNGDTLSPAFVCHLDTSFWDADHVSFRFLGFKPGDSEVCHLLPSHDLVVLPK